MSKSEKGALKKEDCVTERTEGEFEADDKVGEEEIREEISPSP